MSLPAYNRCHFRYHSRLLKIQEQFKLEKKEMIYFGDLKNDILTGKNAGIETYLIDDLINLVIKKKKKLTKN